MYNHYKPLRLAVAIALAVSTPTAFAEVAPFTLGEINVTTTKEELESSRLADNTLTQEDLRLFNRETVGTALNILPGVVMNQAGRRNEQTVMLRGFDLRQVPLYIDGIPVYVSYDGYVDLGRFNTFDLSKIQVSKGFSSVLYGANTLGGAINLVSRKPTKEFEGSARVGFKTDKDFRYNGYSADLNLGGNYGTWYWQANTSSVDNNRYRLSSDFHPSAAENGGDRERSYYHDGKINLKVGLTPNDTDEYSLNYINQQGSRGSPVNASRRDSGDSPVYWDWPQWDKESLYFISNTQLGQDSYVKVRAFYDTFKNSLRIYKDASYTTLDGKPSIYDDFSYGASTEFGTKITDNNTIKLALHYKTDVHREHDKGNPVQRFEDRTTSIGLEDTHQFTDKLALVTGISYDRREALQAEGFNTTTTSIFDFPRKNADAWNPQAGIFYRPTKDSEIHATIAKKSRFATIKDRFSGRFGRAVPNPGLDTEVSTNYEIGASAFVTPKLRLEGSVFYYDTKDLIASFSLPNSACSSGSRCSQYRNIGKVESTGIELATTYYAMDDLELGANYSYIDRDNKSGHEKLTDVPDHKLFAYGKWQATSALALTGNIEAASSRYSRQNGNTKDWFSARGFVIANIKGSYKFNPDWQTEFGVNNITDKNYAYSEGYYLEGRNMFINVTRNF